MEPGGSPFEEAIVSAAELAIIGAAVAPSWRFKSQTHLELGDHRAVLLELPLRVRPHLRVQPVQHLLEVERGGGAGLRPREVLVQRAHGLGVPNGACSVITRTSS